MAKKVKLKTWIRMVTDYKKIMAKKVKRKTWIKMVTDYDAQVKDFYWGDEALGEETSESLVNVKQRFI